MNCWKMLPTLAFNSGKYKFIDIKIIRDLRKLRFSNKSNSNWHSTMQNEVQEELPEKNARPPYRCGKFISKFKEAEKSLEYFNRSRTSLDSVLKLFEEHKDEHPDIPKLLELYEDINKDYLEKVDSNKNHPLIVFEGLDGSGKSTTCIRFAKQTGAEIMQTPPKSLSQFRKKFDGNPRWHAPFYYLGNYVAALEASQILKTKPVVMDRFWHSTTAFALAQMKDDYSDVMKTSTELPENGSEVYEWPQDLLKPDIVIFLNVSEEVRKKRLSRRTAKTDQENLLESKLEFRKNVLSAYENMTNPGVCKVNGDGTFKNVLQEVELLVKNLF